MAFKPPPEFFYLAQAYFHQDFTEFYEDLDELAEDVALGFSTYGSTPVLKRYLTETLPRLTNTELQRLWSKTNAQIQFDNGAELRGALTHIAGRL